MSPCPRHECPEHCPGRPHLTYLLVPFVLAVAYGGVLGLALLWLAGVL